MSGHKSRQRSWRLEILKPIKLIIPKKSMLNPTFPSAVVAGNVETSQNITEALFGALKIVGSSQGTMNNFTFGNEKYQYYETIAGGAGAGEFLFETGYFAAMEAARHDHIVVPKVRRNIQRQSVHRRPTAHPYADCGDLPTTIFLRPTNPDARRLRGRCASGTLPASSTPSPERG